MALGNDVDVGVRFSETPRAPAEIEAYVEPKTKRAAPAGVTSAMFSMLLANAGLRLGTGRAGSAGDPRLLVFRATRRAESPVESAGSAQIPVARAA